MNQGRNKSKKNGKIIRCSFLARPVFEIEACHKFIEYIKFLRRVKLKYEI